MEYLISMKMWMNVAMTQFYWLQRVTSCSPSCNRNCRNQRRKNGDVISKRTNILSSQSVWPHPKGYTATEEYSSCRSANCSQIRFQYSFSLRNDPRNSWCWETTQFHQFQDDGGELAISYRKFAWTTMGTQEFVFPTKLGNGCIRIVGINSLICHSW
jgi:hypothetical protein